MKNRNLLWTISLIAAAAIPLRAYGLGSRCLWLDEAMSASMLDYRPLEIVTRCSEAESVHPPLYFVVLKIWSLAFGDSEVSLRGLSLGFGLVTIAGVYLVSGRLARLDGRDDSRPSTAPLVAALLVALSPMQIELSRTVRGYTLAMALLTFSAWSLLGAVGQPARAGRWVAAALLALAACYTHHLALFSIIAGGLFAAAYLSSGRAGGPARIGAGGLAPGWGGLRGPSAALSVFGAGYLLPWLPRLFAQGETIRHNSTSWPITVKDVLGQILDAVFASYDVGWYGEPAVQLGVAVLLVALMLLLAVRRGWGGRLLASAGLVPPLLMIAFSLHSERSIFHARYLCFSQLAWLAGVAYAIDRVPDRTERRAVAAYAVAASMALCAANWGVIGPGSRPGLRGAIHSILRRCGAGEPIIAETPYAYFGAKYYARGTVDVRLCAGDTNRRRVWGSEHYRDGQLVAPDLLGARNLPGAWLLETDSYDRSFVVPMKVPAGWEAEERFTFAQDRFLEKPIVVTHVRPGAARAAMDPVSLR